MSTLVAQNVGNGSVSTSMANVVNGSAKAWVNFAGSSGSIRASYNVSSVTYNAQGQYTVNFTNSLSDTNYAVAGATGSSTMLSVYGATVFTSSFSTSSCSLYVGTHSAYSGPAYINHDFVHVAFFR